MTKIKYDLPDHVYDDRRDTAKQHQEDARLWQIEREKLKAEIARLQDITTAQVKPMFVFIAKHAITNIRKEDMEGPGHYMPFIRSDFEVQYEEPLDLHTGPDGVCQTCDGPCLIIPRS